jgi:hypothetical protein
MLSLSRGQSRVPSWDGLEGILTSRQLWAVDFRKQKTDENEFRHAGAAILSICDTMGKAPALAADEVFFFNRLAEIWQENAIADIAPEALFLACFCADHSNQKLWRDFAARSTGYSLEFETTTDAVVPMDGLQIVVLKVDYSVASVKDRVRVAFEKVFSLRRKLALMGWDVSTDENLHITLRTFLTIAGYACIQNKTPRHSREKEWRTLVVVEPGRADHVIEEPPRRVCVPLRENGMRPSIRAIHIGRHAPSGSEAQICALLDREGYIDTERPLLVRSTI